MSKRARFPSIVFAFLVLAGLLGHVLAQPSRREWKPNHTQALSLEALYSRARSIKDATAALDAAFESFLLEAGEGRGLAEGEHVRYDPRAGTLFVEPAAPPPQPSASAARDASPAPVATATLPEQPAAPPRK